MYNVSQLCDLHGTSHVIRSFVDHLELFSLLKKLLIVSLVVLGLRVSHDFSVKVPSEIL